MTTKIRKPQVRILQVLAKAKSTSDESSLAAAGKVDKAWLPDALYGRISDLPKGAKEIKAVTPLGKARGEKAGPSLLELGLIRGRIVEVDGKTERRWEITAAGRKALQQLQKSEEK